MKIFFKVSILLLLILLLLLLTACGGYSDGKVVGDGAFKVIGDVGRYDLLKDLNTGCLYLEPHDNLGLTPYYDETGEIAECGVFEE